jgi:ribosome-binding factor A
MNSWALGFWILHSARRLKIRFTLFISSLHYYEPFGLLKLHSARKLEQALFPHSICFMKLRHERLADAIRTIASEHMIQHFQEYENSVWIVSIVEVEITPDEWYADIYVSSSEKWEESTLPKLLAPLAKNIAHSIGKDIGIRRSPIIRFRLAKKTKSGGDILSIINSLDKQYGLSE